ncbi:NAD(P)-dependent dehydrogenase (short-subunit alcohol dehydrogenase family) [Nocardia transvalensis]|uniref:NAD(P)-dependent dehydrogenase (Short-subunit alcohol dehydrogenase family) n=1 Tax=Nocardia transvalensis TaxID=37333 RepID=A0A7W9PLL2_9NOCA|nr:SDR family oxidoreductase [Nocardia transvalensis]MBB5918282.1 NAD(P)-dependent dehydrogenase (short-subunit alcohol dehydrogenase family) [Nocardia transvalensis]
MCPLTPPEPAYRPVPLLEDKVVVVSGVGPGLGTALATEAAAMGATLVLVSRTERRIEKLADEIRGRGRAALAVPADITDEQQRAGVVERVLAEFGRADCLINNAFAIPPMDPITQIDVAALRTANETNVFAPLRLSALFADALAASRGSIIMVNSCVSYSSQPEFSGYKLSKGALAHLASSLATELGPRGIRVNSVAPSYVYEDINKAYFDWLASQAGVTHADIYQEKAGPTDLQRLAGPEEVARATLFLASDLASAVTGQMLTVDCGEFHR